MAYLLEVCRYVDLNPMRTGMVAGPEAGALARAVQQPRRGADRAHTEGGLTMTALAGELGLQVFRVTD